MTPLEPWKRVYVKEDFFITEHGQMHCVECHDGNRMILDKDKAHEGLVAYPTDEDYNFYCSECHFEQVSSYEGSLHNTQEGFFNRISLRAGFDIRDSGYEHFQDEFNDECATCHAGCGQCHVSRPKSVGGGLNWGHEFSKTPDLKTNCTACHGSRIGDEYTGLHEGVKADVHYIPNVKKCEFCHCAQEMHGCSDQDITCICDECNTKCPKCVNCHPYSQESNRYHTSHWSGDSGVTLSCQVCHSQAYRNCNGCHVGGAKLTGSSYCSFEIGRNYLKDNERYKDYDYITVRHIPIAPDTFKEWGLEELEHFESQPTWKLTIPHNIQRWTPQTKTADGAACFAACHDSEYYLREKDVYYYENANYDNKTGETGYGYSDIERELTANKDVFIPE